MTDRELPNDALIEIAVIGSIIRYPNKYNDISKYIVSDKVWYEPKCKILWNILSAMIKRREHIDIMTVSSNLNDGDYINGVDNVFVVDCSNNCGTEGSVDLYAKKIYEKYLLRLVIDHAKDIQKNAMNNKADALDTSTMLLNLLSNVLTSNKKVMLFNRELTNVEVLKKLIALESGKLSYTMIRQGIYEMGHLQELDRARKFIAKKYSPNKFRMYDQIRDFPTSATEIKKFKPDVIFDDYIQLITPSGKEEQRRLQLERIVNDYKWIAKEYNCSVILASQLNRSLETRGNPRPQLSDLAESGAIEQVAENVFFVYYPYKVQASSKPEDKNKMTLVAAKVRYGETGAIQMAYNGDKCKIYNSEEEMFEPIQVKEHDEIPF